MEKKIGVKVIKCSWGKEKPDNNQENSNFDPYVFNPYVFFPPTHMGFQSYDYTQKY